MDEEAKAPFLKVGFFFNLKNGVRPSLSNKRLSIAFASQFDFAFFSPFLPIAKIFNHLSRHSRKMAEDSKEAHVAEMKVQHRDQHLWM